VTSTEVHAHVRVRSPQARRLFALLHRHGFRVRHVDRDELWVEDSTVDEVGRLAQFFQVPLHHLTGDVDPDSS
jgi:hypothetical protein